MTANVQKPNVQKPNVQKPNVQKPNVQKPRYHGTGGSLLRLAIVNFVLSALTLGIYSFWAKSKVRAFHYGATEMAADRFAYHGTGGELFVGALKAIGVLAAMAIGWALLTFLGVPATPPAAQPFVLSLVGVLYAALMLVLFAVAVNGARRYRLSRSSWRGIHFAFVGRWQDYLALVVKGALFSVATLGFYSPISQNHQRAFLVNNARYGSQAFRYAAESRDLFIAYLKAVLLTVPTLGLCWVWYAAFRHRYFWEHTSIAGAQFRSTVTGGGLLALSLTNALLVLVTLGLGTPWATVRTHRFWSDQLRLQGKVDWANIHERALPASAVGEGLAQRLHADADVGLAV
jgi:uncharacterized membrane protein YjgN (DUF898 family)